MIGTYDVLGFWLILYDIFIFDGYVLTSLISIIMVIFFCFLQKCVSIIGAKRQ